MKWKIPWLQVHVVLIFKVVFFSCANFLCPPTSIVVPRSQGLFRRWPKGSRPMGKRLTFAEYFTYIVSSNNYFPHCNVDNRINKSCGRKLCTGHPTRTKFSFFCHETCTSFVMIFKKKLVICVEPSLKKPCLSLVFLAHLKSPCTQWTAQKYLCIRNYVIWVALIAASQFQDDRSAVDE